MTRSTLTVSTRSWHGRAYAYWRKRAVFKTEGYRENLCHYVRVVLFWFPISWLANRKLFKVNDVKITPGAVLLLIAALVGIVTVAILDPWGTLAGAGLVVAGLAVAVGMCYASSVINDRHNEIESWWSGFGPKLSVPFRWFYQRVLRPIGRFLMLEVGTTKIPFFAPILAAGYIASATQEPELLLYTLIGAGVAIAFAVVVIGMLLFVNWLQERNRRKGKDEGFVEVAWRFAGAKKGKICPYIEVEGNN